MPRGDSQYAARRAVTPAEKKAPPVWRHRKKHGGHGGDEHAWAVSYVDLLMVLMSFFIVFFSTDPGKERDEIVERLTTTFQQAQREPTKDMGGTAEGGPKQGLGKGDAPPGQEVKHDPVIKNLTEMLKKEANVKVDVSQLDSKGIVVDLSDDVFPPGGYRPTPNLRKEVNSVLNVVKPIQDLVQLIFVGHTDEIPVRVRGTRSIIASNLILSDLRASYTAGVAVEQGFKTSRISTQGFAEFARGTRSVSLHILRKGAKK